MAPPGFLDLPPEIRNRIYCELIVEPSIDAQERYVRPRGNGRNPAGQPVRRQPPPYPEIAATNRQVRGESLSIFYACNLFALVKPAGAVSRDPAITDPAVLLRWSPPAGYAAFVTRVNVGFAALPRGGAHHIGLVYEVRRSGGRFSVSFRSTVLGRADLNTDPAAAQAEAAETARIGRRISLSSEEEEKRRKEETCFCAENALVHQFNSAAAILSGGSLLKVAGIFLHMRLVTLFGATTLGWRQTYQAPEVKCAQCEKITLFRVDAGL